MAILAIVLVASLLIGYFQFNKASRTIDSQEATISGLEAELNGINIVAKPESITVKDTAQVLALEERLAQISAELNAALDRPPAIDTQYVRPNVDALLNEAFEAGRSVVQQTAYFDTLLTPGKDVLALSMEFDYPKTALRMQVG